MDCRLYSRLDSWLDWRFYSRLDNWVDCRLYSRLDNWVDFRLYSRLDNWVDFIIGWFNDWIINWLNLCLDSLIELGFPHLQTPASFSELPGFNLESENWPRFRK